MITFDPDTKAVISPDSFTFPRCPAKALIIYEDLYFEKLSKEKNLEPALSTGGKPIRDVYILDNQYLIINPPEGAPTSAMILEMAIASGVKSVLAFGTAGSLHGEMLPHRIILPTSAIRDEGVSYHYAPESDEIEQDRESLDLLKSEIQKHGLDFTEGKTWTTDAFFRETESKVKQMKEKGCVCVDMECSALIAVCKFRKIKFVQFLLSFDNLEANHNHHETYVNSMDDSILKIAFETLDKLNS